MQKTCSRDNYLKYYNTLSLMSIEFSYNEANSIGQKNKTQQNVSKRSKL